jgi:tetratricopeptide (TPR) repeat protein
MVRTNTLIGLMLLAQASIAAPAFAGMNQDLADCTAADRAASADACTRVMDSGRLPNNQLYIGHHNRGWSYFNAGDADKALADFDKSIEHNPDYADTYYARAVVQQERGARDNALSDLDRYLDLKKNDWKARFNRALMFRWRGENDLAFDELQRAEKLNPGDQKIAGLRALVLSDKGEQGPARAEADKIISADAKDAQAYYARALVAFRENKLTEADADAEKAITLKEAFPAAHTLLGRIEEERNKKDLAATHYHRALAITPKSVDARAAQAEARDRLAAIPAVAAVGETVRRAEQSAQLAASLPSGSDCRRFIPAASITIAVDCSE